MDSVGNTVTLYLSVRGDSPAGREASEYQFTVQELLLGAKEGHLK